LRKLRVAELAIFGLPAVFFLLLQHRVTLDDAARGFMPPPLPFWLLLIFTYGMFIPNTWRRAACVIGALALAPDLLVVGMMLAHPEVGAVMTGMKKSRRGWQGTSLSMFTHSAGQPQLSGVWRCRQVRVS
jgi:hypothetical protein